MNDSTKEFFRRLLITLVVGYFTAWNTSLHAQKPDVKAVDKVKGSTGEIVSVKGSNFGTDATKLSVFFGATKGVIESVDDQLLQVHVPSGTTFNNLSVGNKTTGLIGYSREQFLLSFRGDQGFNLSNLETQLDFPAESGLYDLCMCDFDGDKKVDIHTGNKNANLITILTNISTGPGIVNFSKISPLLNTYSLHIKCGDLNGDGKPDLVVSEDSGDRIFVFQNNSAGTGSFLYSSQIIKLTGRKPLQIEIADLDLDGKPEIIVTDRGSNIISILVNNSTVAAISFRPTPVNVTITGAVNTDGLAVEDLNGDFLPEIITGQFFTKTNIFIVANKSYPGTFSLTDITVLPLTAAGGAVANLKVGDLDGDRKPDIAATLFLDANVSIFLNKSTLTALSFSSSTAIPTDPNPWGVDFGDLDGDGKADIVIASVTKKSLTILNNTSVPGSLTFTKLIKPTTFINQHVNIGDVDGDGKPDIAFTSIDDNNAGIFASKVSIFRNKTCMVPEIIPAGPIAVCAGFPLRLFATASRGVTYDWKKDGVTQISGPNPFLDVTASGNYTVTANAESGSCSKVSNTVAVTVAAGSASDPKPLNNGPVCIGSDLKLSVSNVTAGITYQWTGPAGYTGSGATPPNVTNFSIDNAGVYYVSSVVTAGGCVARRDSTIVGAIDIPAFQVGYSGSLVMCLGDPAKTLSVVPLTAGFTYQWFKDGILLSGETGTTYAASASGNYHYQASYSGCSSITTPDVKVALATTPIVNFITNPATSACMGQQVLFTNQSTADPTVDPVFTWTFGDGNTSTDKDPIHVYATANTFSIKLQVTYAGGACPVENTKSITITAAPVAAITNPDSKFIFCSGDSLKLEVLGSFTSYAWSTGETTSSIYVKDQDTYTVDVGTAVCTLTATKDVDKYNAPTVTITADPQQLDEGGSSQLTASGLVDYLWSPDETLSNATASNPIATPVSTTTYIVSGSDVNGCLGQASFELKVKGEAIVDKLKPRSFFSPNGGGPTESEFWVIDKILDYPQCNIAIYDEKGIKVYEAKPYLNTWDGTFNGNGSKRLPDGVYFYVIRCDGEESKPKSGSITLLR